MNSDWSLARKLGEGVTITSEAMWVEYLEWCNDQECEECGAKYSDRPRDGDVMADMWVTETLCGKCFYGEQYEAALAELKGMK